ncbi:MAG: trigger factor [Candidatus Gorgyraea atricola]|nr:trigger factor [Candidatus Gorgyraea atricola]
MKSNIKKLKNCKKIVEVKLSVEKVKDELEKVYKGIGKVASVPGYRVGKAPRDLLEQHYAKTAKEEALKNLIPETYRKILEEHKLDPIGYPEVSDVKMDLKEGLSYTASIETRPDFSLRSYKGLRLKKKSVEVKEEDVQKNLESLREANAQQVPKKDGEEKEKVVPKLDDEFAKDMGCENLEKLKDAVRQSLKQRLEQDSAADLEVQIINQLVEAVNFEVPESLVNGEKERLVKDANSRIAYMQAIQNKQNPDKKFTLSDKDKKELEENAGKQALRQVKAFFILDKIAQAEKIQLKQEDIDKRIEEMAVQYKKSKEEVRSHLEKNHMLDEMAVNMRNAKVMESLLKEAKVS